jgi:predicted enzyme related to lactoylglutathione lyase
MTTQYLEIVTPDVDGVCAAYERMHGVTFGEGDPALGGARTAKLAGGGLIGVRPPLRDTEEPVVRPYMLVQDLEAAVNAAEEAGAEVAVRSMELEGHGVCAILVQGGIDMGLWQL